MRLVKTILLSFIFLSCYSEANAQKKLIEKFPLDIPGGYGGVLELCIDGYKYIYFYGWPGGSNDLNTSGASIFVLQPMKYLEGVNVPQTCKQAKEVEHE